MATKLRAQREGLAIVAFAVVTANLPQETIMKITANRTVDKATAGDVPIGRLTVPSKTANGIGTVETRFKEFVEFKTTAALTAGQPVKLGVYDAGTNESTVALFVQGTDAEALKIGVVWNGAASGAIAEVLTY